MGRIKSALVKKTAKKLYEEHDFKQDFKENKALINGLLPSKKIKNMVAGYITKLKSIHAKQKA
ncbi:MAG: 30S ribosomal protein S17e [Nanoarchaeota archaeon]|nr:30S ribosomal protein S17e [Nanoarchaeota archaeon]